MGYSLVEFTPVEKVRPATDWLFSMTSQQVRSMILKRLNQIRNGNLGDHKSLGYDLYEFRIFYQTGYRIYFIRNRPDQITLLCAGSKTTQKRDIERARALHELSVQSHHMKISNYKHVIKDYISTYDRAAYYIHSHQPRPETEFVSFEMLPVMLSDLVSVYGYAKIANMLQIRAQKLFAHISQKIEVDRSILSTLEDGFSMLLHTPDKKVVNQ